MRDQRIMFGAYLAVILAGLAVFIAVGLAHR
jgi:hypothetical protein